MSSNLQTEDFEKVLKSIEKEQDLECQFEASILAQVLCMGGVVAGLSNGQVVLTNIQTSISTTIMQSDTGGHTGGVFCLASTPDGSKVVSGSGDGTLRVWNLAAGREEAVLTGHTKRVDCLAITKDGSKVVSGSEDTTVRVWSLATRKEEMTLKGHTQGIFCVAITPDSGMAVTCSNDGTTRVWSLWSGTEELGFASDPESACCLAITPDGMKAVTGTSKGKVHVRNLVERTQETVLEGIGWVANLVITPDGSRAVLSAGRLLVWNLAEGREEPGFEGRTNNVGNIAITSDGTRVVTGLEFGNVVVWSVAERKQESLFTGPSCLISLSSDGKIVASSLGQMSVWRLAKGREEIFFEGHSIPADKILITPDGSRAVSASNDWKIRVWNLAERRQESELEWRPSHIAITPDGSTLVTCCGGEIVRLWNLAERKAGKVFPRLSHSLSCLAITPDGTRVVLACQGMKISVWNLAEGTEELVFTGLTDEVNCLAITTDGSRVVTGSNTVHVWKLAEGKEEPGFDWEAVNVNKLVIAHDGIRAVTCATGDSTVHVWNLATRRHEAVFKSHTQKVRCIAITPDSRKVVTSSDDRTVRVWNLAELREETVFASHTQPVDCLAISQDGVRAVSSSGDQTIRVWNLAERREEANLEVHKRGNVCMAIAHDGQRLVTSSYDNRIYITNIEGNFGTGDASQSTTSDLRLAVSVWREGTATAASLAKCTYPSHYFNSLHICAYFNKYELLAKFLKAGVPILRGDFASPLTMALKRNSGKCVDAILQHFIGILETPSANDSSWIQFETITEDLPQLLYCKCSLLQMFFSVLMQPPAYPPLAEFIVPALPLPAIKQISSRYVDISDFDKSATNEESSQKQEQKLVKFSVGLPRWNFAAGSEQSIKLLTAFAECENRLVLATQYVSTLIEAKWSSFYALTVIITTLYFLLLADISCILFLNSSPFSTFTFLALNTFFVLYECALMIATRTAYFTSLLNWVDIVRGGSSIAWTILLLSGHDPVKGTDEMKYLTLAVIVLCYIRGFSYFCSFRITRIFMSMTIAVMKEMYSFLVILWYSVLAFGMFLAVLLEFSTVTQAWTNGYNLIIGNYDISGYGTVEWVMFACATIANVVIMLNLLVSILGEAYEKTHMSIRENDLHQQLFVILEYESLMFWRRNDRSQGTVVVTCREAEDASECEEWKGQILHITKTIKTAVEEHFARFEGKVDKMDEKITATEGKVTVIGKSVGKTTGMEKVEEKVTAMDEKMSGVGRIEDKMTAVEAEITEMKEKIMGIDGQLKAILGIISTRT